jgi:hypothetical protein
VIGAPSRFRVIRKTTTLTRIEETREFIIEEQKRKSRGESGRILPYLITVTELLKLQKSGQFPDEPVRIKF